MEIRYERSGRESGFAARELRLREPEHDQRRDGNSGGVGGGKGYNGHAIFYVGVSNVEAALQKAERLGGTRQMGPEKNPEANLVVGHFTDPEGHLIT